MSNARAMLHNLDAEQHLLCAMLLDARAAEELSVECSVDDFYHRPHRIVFDALRELANSGHAIDLMGLTARLIERNELEVVGGQEWLLQLGDYVPTAANRATPLRLVRECRRRRDLLRALENGVEALRGGGVSATDVHGAVQADLIALGDAANPRGFRPLDLEKFLDNLDARESGHLPGICSGFPALDARTGGFLPGELVIIGAPPKHLKTTLACQWGLQVAVHAGVGVGFVSAEMSNLAITERMVSALSGIPMRALREGKLTGTEPARLARASGQLRVAPLWLDDAGAPKLEDVVARVLALKGNHPSLGVVVVDFLQLVQYRLKGRRGDEEITAVSYALKDLAMRAEVVLLAPTQLNAKAIADREDRRPTLRDVSGSSGPLMAGDFVMLLHRPSQDPGAAPNGADYLRVYVDAARRTEPFEFALEWQSVVMRGIPASRANWIRPDAPLEPFSPNA